METTIWFDITNVPHVHFFRPMIRHLEMKGIKCLFSVRDFAETKKLFENTIGSKYYESGVHQGGNKVKKFLGLVDRTIDLEKIIPDFDFAIGVGNTSTGVIAKIRHKYSVSFDDNDCSANWLYSPFTDLAFWPDCISKDVLRKQFFKDKSIYQYHGYKEDIYLADYVPNSAFLSELPFDHYVVVRPENLKAGYVSGTTSIVPALLERLHSNGVNVLFLPRYESDRQLAARFDNIFVPKSAVNGLDACYYSDAVLTGAGTMAREAACLGVPAVSFYAGAQLLTVDQSLISQKKMLYSRDVSTILAHLDSAMKTETDLSRCKLVQQEVLDKLDSFIEQKQIKL